jgi:hypothetical protein
MTLQRCEAERVRLRLSRGWGSRTAASTPMSSPRGTTSAPNELARSLTLTAKRIAVDPVPAKKNGGVS